MIMVVLAVICWTADAQNNSQMSNMGNGQMMNMDMQGTQDSQTKITVTNSATLKAVIDDYLAIKNALVKDNSMEAANSGKALFEALSNVDLSTQATSGKDDLANIIEDAKEHAQHISENAGDIEHQRGHLSSLSADLKNIIVIAGADRTLYELHCPMYNNMEGADWLSESNKILNPFYGSKMINCGSVQQEIALK